jgi:hypothetical protein
MTTHSNKNKVHKAQKKQERRVDHTRLSWENEEKLDWV